LLLDDLSFDRAAWSAGGFRDGAPNKRSAGIDPTRQQGRVDGDAPRRERIRGTLLRPSIYFRRTPSRGLRIGGRRASNPISRRYAYECFIDVRRRTARGRF
jgi:hypothetical protein